MFRRCGICRHVGHNCRTCPSLNSVNKLIKIENIGTKGTNINAINNEKKIENDFNNNLAYNNNLCKLLSVCESNVTCTKVVKKNGFDVKHTNEWMNLKKGTKETSASSKADICICNIKGNICESISIKSGKGRLTSSDCYETNAILKSVYNKNYDIKLYNMIEEIITSMKMLGKKKPLYNNRNRTSIQKEMKNDSTLKDDDTIWIDKLNYVENKCNEIWKLLKNNYPEYIKDVLFECVSGKYKFGENDGRANWLLITENSHTTKIDKLFKLDRRTEELDKYLWNNLPNNPFKMKSGGTGKVMWIRFL